MTEIRHRIRQHPIQVRPEIEAGEIFVSPDPAETSESIGENGADCGRQCASGSGVCGACMAVLPASPGRKETSGGSEKTEKTASAGDRLFAGRV